MRKLSKEFIYDGLIFALTLVGIVSLYQDNLLLTLVLSIAWIIGAKFWHRKHDVYFFIGAAVLGPLAEVIAIHFGVWSYANPFILGIPMWLPLAWGLCIIFMKRLVELFIRMEKIG
jgi:hypothetical protein